MWFLSLINDSANEGVPPTASFLIADCNRATTRDQILFDSSNAQDLSQFLILVWWNLLASNSLSRVTLHFSALVTQIEMCLGHSVLGHPSLCQDSSPRKIASFF
jgi:hypothetical protein